MVDDLFEMTDEGAAIVRLHVQPGAGRTAVVGRHGDAVKVRVAAPPEGGRANEAVVKLVAEMFAVKPAAVTLLSGESSRSKRVAIADIESDEVKRLLELALEDATHGGKR
jgi:uncharacterized protein (TIGR00251 family)